MLKTLRIFGHHDIERNDAAEDLEEQLFTAPFPRLHILCLSTWSEIVNGRDLWLLGQEGAWARLTDLSIS